MAASRRILLVEADALARNNFVRTLDGHGFDIDVAATAEAAIERAEQTTYAVIVLDDAIRRASTEDPLPRLGELQPGAIPMLVATERTFVRVSEAVNDQGIQGVLTKPWARESLVTNMQRGLRLYHQTHGQRLATKALEQAVKAAGEHRRLLDEAMHLATAWVERHAVGEAAPDEEAVARLEELQARFGRTGGRVFTLLSGMSAILQPPTAGEATDPATKDLDAGRPTAEPEPLPEEDAATTSVDRRQYPRVPLSIEVYLRDDEKLWTATSEDISVGGVLVRTERPSKAGEVIDIELRLPGNDTALLSQARVMRVRRKTGPLGHGVEAGLGLQFVGLPASAARTIDTFVNQWDADVLEHLELLA